MLDKVERPAGWRVAALLALVAVAGCGPAPQTPAAGPGEWREFEGAWTAAGSRQTMRLGDTRQVSIASFNGTLMLAGPRRPGEGVRADAIVLNDSATGMVGRAVWTDEHGDQVFSELRGEGSATGNRIVGNFVGGTGRYADASGSYAFAWRFVLEGDDGVVQGQSVGLKGRIRLGAAATGGTTP